MITALRHHWLMTVAGMMLLASAGGVYVYTHVISNWFLERTRQVGFVLNELHVSGLERTGRDDVLAILDVDNGMPLLGIDLPELQARIETLPWVKEAVITRILPGDLHVKVIERRPFALWQIDERIRLIDQDGTVITSRNLSEFQDLLQIVGSTTPAEISNFLKIVQLSPSLAGQIKSAVRVSKRRWDVIFHSGIRVKLPEDYAAEYDSKAAWEKFIELESMHKLLAREISVIDMRLPERMILRVTPAGQRRMQGLEWAT